MSAPELYRTGNPDWCFFFMCTLVDYVNDAYSDLPERHAPEILRLVRESDEARELLELMTGGTIADVIEEADTRAFMMQAAE